MLKNLIGVKHFVSHKGPWFESLTFMEVITAGI